MPESRQYELVYVISPEVGEDGIADLHTQIEEIIVGLGGRIEKTDNWGRRRLAYEIGKHREGIYVVILIQGPGEIVKELDRKLKVLDTVLRHLVVRVDEDLRKAERLRQKRLPSKQRRRAAFGSVSTEAKSSEDTKEAEESKGDDASARESAEVNKKAEVQE